MVNPINLIPTIRSGSYFAFLILGFNLQLHLIDAVTAPKSAVAAPKSGQQTTIAGKSAPKAKSATTPATTPAASQRSSGISSSIGSTSTAATRGTSSSSTAGPHTAPVAQTVVPKAKPGLKPFEISVFNPKLKLIHVHKRGITPSQTTPGTKYYVTKEDVEALKAFMDGGSEADDGVGDGVEIVAEPRDGD